ncbi:hypothetical protein ONE63_005159 [Megalurothrips usitatus]|nr:hypothetical protein ONE63_005159 [Megalurothrips usitatus]
MDVEATFNSRRRVSAITRTVIQPNEVRGVEYKISPLPIASAAVFTPRGTPSELLPLECIIEGDTGAIPVHNTSDVPLAVEPGDILGDILPEDIECAPKQISKFAFRNPTDTEEKPNQDQGVVCSTSKPPLPDINPALTKEQREQLEDLLQEYQDVFYQKGDPLRTTNILEVSLELKDDTLYYIPQYKLNPQQIQAANEEIQKLLRQNVVREEPSNYCLPLLVVPKATPPDTPQRWRVVLDARPLNRRLKTICFKGTPSEIYFKHLRNGKFFSQLDLVSSYQQLRVNKKSQQYLAFQHEGRSYVYLSLPFGVAHAGELFQYALNSALKGLLYKDLVTYVDDATVATKDFPRHLEVLSQVFQRFRKYVFTLNPEKCRFGYFEAKALGMIVTEGAIRPDPARLRPVEQLLSVTCKKRAKSVLAYFSFFRKFLPRFSARTAILAHAAHPQQKFAWSQQHADLVLELYNEIRTAVLRHFDENRPTRLLTDGSRAGIGSLLAQLDPTTRKWHPVAHYSRILSPAERNYSMTAIELLAIAASCTHFRHELLSLKSPCEVQTDCRALIYLKASKYLHPPIARLQLSLEGYPLTLKHVPGANHLAADALSRNPLPNDFKDSHIEPLPGEEYETDNTVSAVTRAQAASASPPGTAAGSAADAPLLTPARPQGTAASSQHGNGRASSPAPPEGSSEQDDSDAESDWDVPTGTEGDVPASRKYLSEVYALQQADPEIKSIIESLPSDPSTQEKFQIIDTVLYAVRGTQRLLYVPALLRKDVLQQSHEPAHFGKEKTLQSLSRYVYWPSMRKDCENFVASCTRCQTFKRKPQREGHLHSITAEHVNDKVCIDFKSAPLSSKGKKEILIYVDVFTRYVRLYACKGHTTDDAIKALRRAFLEAGIPRTIICDADPAFTSHDFKSFTDSTGCDLHVIPPNAHQANGLAEAFCKIAGERLALACQDLKKWDDDLLKLQLHINDSRSKSLDQTPFYLLHGYHPKTAKFQLLANHPASEDIALVRQAAQDALETSQARLQSRYNESRTLPEYVPGQEVWIFVQKKSTSSTPSKYAHKWREGRVTKIINPVTLEVSVQQRGMEVIKKVHINFVKPRVKRFNHLQ